jgi:hypothetical protein
MRVSGSIHPPDGHVYAWIRFDKFYLDGSIWISFAEFASTEKIIVKPLVNPVHSTSCGCTMALSVAYSASNRGTNLLFLFEACPCE